MIEDKEVNLCKDDLVQYQIDITNLDSYMQNIIKVVNQHAKVLDQLAIEVSMKTNEHHLGDLLAVCSLGFPYKQSQKACSLDEHPERPECLLKEYEFRQFEPEDE